jgi:4-hydroxybenzoate polyprenyltransferase
VGISYGLVPIGIWLAFDPAGIFKQPDYGSILPLPAIFLGLMMCFTDWGFTLSGVARDVEGDRARGAPTFPVTFVYQYCQIRYSQVDCRSHCFYSNSFTAILDLYVLQCYPCWLWI